MVPLRKKKKRKYNRKIFKITLIVIAFVFFTITFSSLYIYSRTRHITVSLTENLKRLPVVMEELSKVVPEASQIFDSDGQLIAIIHLGERRFYTQLKDISPYLIKAVVAMEDIRFYTHYGIDLRGIIRALWVNLRERRIAEGGSTITQQLARDLFNLTLEKTFDRKIQEIVIAWQLEKEYSKDEILEMYLNIYFLGEGNYGVEAASRYYFGKASSDLTLSEAALLAGIFKAPSLLNPKANYEASVERMKIILDIMLKNEIISEKEYYDALENKPQLKTLEETFSPSVQYFVDYVKSYLQTMLPREVIFGGGLKVYTTLDQKIQSNLESALNFELDKLVKNKVIKEVKDNKDVRQPQGAMIALNPRTGDIMGMIGGRDYKETPLNRVFSLRQPGSTFKAFVYSAAFESKLVTPLTILDSEPMTLDTPKGPWSPTEYVRVEGKKFYGPMDIRDALVRSSNIVAVKVGLAQGLKEVISYARAMGITSRLEEVYSLPIGSNDVTLFELSFAYSPLANGGYKVEPRPVKNIITSNGVVVREFTTVKGRVIKEETAYVLTDILKDVAKRELSGGLKVTFPAAGKTGTSDKHRDAWFVGYTTDLLIGVWTGSDEENPQINSLYNTGLFAQKIWQRAIVPYLTNKEVLDFVKPDSVEEKMICIDSKLLSTSACPTGKIKREIFMPSTAPKELCPLH